MANSCIKHSVNYIDLSDGRDFVRDISTLDAAAKKSGIVVISGSSTVPGLSSSVLEKYKNEFSEINSLVFGITPGQKAERGLAATKGILSYIGKPLKAFVPNNKLKYGWQNLYHIKYPDLGRIILPY